MSSPEEKLRRIALYTRIGLIVLSCSFNLIISDHVSDGFISPSLTNDKENTLDKGIDFLLGGLLRWDAQHFFHISRYGYTYETNLAFFPLFPTVVSYGSNPLMWMFGINFRSAFLIVSTVLNSALFIKSTIALFKLTEIVFGDSRFAFNAALFFCFSPASIFFIAPYSETIFTFFAFNGMLSYAKQEFLLASLWFSFATFARSNGLLNAGFLCHYFFYKVLIALKFNQNNNIIFFMKRILISTILTFIVIVPYLLFQIKCFYNFCNSPPILEPELIDYADEHNLIKAGTLTPWCLEEFPNSYGYVQDRYWNVGFLKYFQMKQIPNFCLALPTVSLILYYSLKFLIDNKHLLYQPEILYNKQTGRNKLFSLPKLSFVYVVHAVVLTLFCFFNINVQVTTRMLASSSPVLYWIASSNLLVKDKNSPPEFNYLRRKIIEYKDNFNPSCNNFIRYFGTYAILGTVLFSNNFPWT